MSRIEIVADAVKYSTPFVRRRANEIPAFPFAKVARLAFQPDQRFDVLATDPVADLNTRANGIHYQYHPNACSFRFAVCPANLFGRHVLVFVLKEPEPSQIGYLDLDYFVK